MLTVTVIAPVDIDAEDRAEQVVLAVLAVAAAVALVPILDVTGGQPLVLIIAVASVAEGQVEQLVCSQLSARP